MRHQRRGPRSRFAPHLAPHQYGRSGIGSIHVVRPARRDPRQNPRRLSGGPSHGARRWHGEHADAEGHLRPHCVQSFRARWHRRIAGLRVRQQSAAAGGPGQLQAIALDTCNRLATLPALVSKWAAGQVGYPPGAAARSGTSRRSRARHEVRPGDRISCLPHSRYTSSARSRPSSVARSAASRDDDPSRLQFAHRVLVRHGRGAAADRAAHRAGPRLAAAVA